MRTTDLIKRLQELVEKHGDLPVFSVCDHNNVDGAHFIDYRWIYKDMPIGEDMPVIEIY